MKCSCDWRASVRWHDVPTGHMETCVTMPPVCWPDPMEWTAPVSARGCVANFCEPTNKQMMKTVVQPTTRRGFHPSQALSLMKWEKENDGDIGNTEAQSEKKWWITRHTGQPDSVGHLLLHDVTNPWDVLKTGFENENKKAGSRNASHILQLQSVVQRN